MLRNVAFDDRAPLIEGDAPGSRPHVAVIGVGHLAGAVDDAAHHPDTQVFQMPRAFLDAGERPLQVVKRTAAAGTGDVFGAAETHACRLQDHPLHLLQLPLPEPGSDDTDAVSQPVQEQRPEVGRRLYRQRLERGFAVAAAHGGRTARLQVEQRGPQLGGRIF